MSDIEHYVKRCSELSRENDALQARVAELERVIKSHQGAQFGDESPCYFCGEPVNGLHGNPNLWPLYFCHEDDPGVAKPHHTGCVTDRLTELAAKTAECEKAYTFKDYVHARLDEEGVPSGDPENQHQKDGCRIGARFDLLFGEHMRVLIATRNLASDSLAKTKAERDTALRDLATAREECERWKQHNEFILSRWPDDTPTPVSVTTT